MSMDEERIKKVYDYFQKCGTRRYGDWMTEIRRSIGLELKEMGVKSSSVAKILCTGKTSTRHYHNFNPNPMIEAIVAEKKWEWIEEQVYPMTERRRVDNVLVIDYVLTSTPMSYIRKPKKRRLVNSSLDKFIDSL